MKIKTQHGFTLIELVVVIAILGILAGIAIPRFMDAQATARGSRIVADIRTLESALNIYRINNTITGTPDITILTTGTTKYVAAIPVPPVGTAVFPNGRELDIDKSDTYKLYTHKTLGLVVVLNSKTQGSVPLMNLIQ